MKRILTFEKFDVTKNLPMGKFPEPQKTEVRELPTPKTRNRKGGVIKIPGWNQY